MFSFFYENFVASLDFVAGLAVYGEAHFGLCGAFFDHFYLDFAVFGEHDWAEGEVDGADGIEDYSADVGVEDWAAG